MTTELLAADIAAGQIQFDRSGLVPAVIQDSDSQDVLMIGFMNETAFRKTVETGFTHFWSRSRDILWKKGESSGNTQHVESISINCERNALLLQVRQTGAVCHDGYPTCFYREFQEDGTLRITRDRWFDPTLVYGKYRHLIPLWWGAYEYLRDHVDQRQSGTAALLQSESTSARRRVADELLELKGVLSGDHHHTNMHDDLILEGSQVLYWIVVEVIRRRHSLDEINVTTALSTTTNEVSSELAQSLLEAEVTRLRTAAKSLSAEEATALIALVAQVVSGAGVQPTDLIDFDLADLRAKPYLQPYFDQDSAGGI